LLGEGDKETIMTNLTVAGTNDHPITIGPIAERVRVVWRGRTIGDSRSALELKEANYAPVVYGPAPTWT
jgi:uncharacterized protein (DUF427 family)